MKIKGVSPILLATFLLLADVAFAAESITVRIKDGRIDPL
jgi:hypothetical protein